MIKSNKNIKNDDFYISDEGYYVFSEKYHLKRGYCCKNNCKHCPYNKKKKKNEYTKGRNFKRYSI